MPVFRVTYRSDSAADTASELVEADRVDLESEAWVVFRRTVFVIGTPREIVVRRLPAAPVADVAEVVP